jgi:hypothetical protein
MQPFKRFSAPHLPPRPAPLDDRAALKPLGNDI